MIAEKTTQRIKSQPFAFPLKPYKPFVAAVTPTVQEMICRKYQGLHIPKDEDVQRFIKTENSSLSFSSSDTSLLRHWLTTLAGSQWFPNSAMTESFISCRYSESLNEIRNKINASISNKNKQDLARIVGDNQEALTKMELFNHEFSLDFGTFEGENHEEECDSAVGIFVNCSGGVIAYQLPLAHLPYKQAVAIIGWIKVITQALEFHLYDDDAEEYYCGELPTYKTEYDSILQEVWRTNNLPNIEVFESLVDVVEVNWLAEYQFGKTFSQIEDEDKTSIIEQVISYWLRKMIYNDLELWSIKDVNAIDNTDLVTFLKQSNAYFSKISRKFSAVFLKGFGHLDPNHSIQPHFGEENSILNAYEYDLTKSAHRSMMEGDEYGVYEINLRHPHIKEYFLCRAAGTVFLQHLLSYLP